MEYYEFPVIPAWLIYTWIAIAIIELISLWKVFEKAGQPGWAALIPFYNIYIMTRIAGKPAIWTLWCVIPFINLVFIVWLYNIFCKSFGKDEAFTVGFIILPVIFWPILGFGPAKYLGPFGDPVAFQAYQQRQFEFER
jgi:hypothetical protein